TLRADFRKSVVQPLRFLLTSRTQAPQRRFGSFILFAAVLAVSLSACGWRLQGTSRLPPIMTAAYVEAEDRYSEFNRALRDSLRASGARLTERRTEATAVVRILDEESGQRVLSVSARN